MLIFAIPVSVVVVVFVTFSQSISIVVQYHSFTSDLLEVLPSMLRANIAGKMLE